MASLTGAWPTGQALRYPDRSISKRRKRQPEGDGVGPEAEAHGSQGSAALGISLPERIETARLVLRCWRPRDAALLKEAIDVSVDHLKPWMPWAAAAPFSLSDTEDTVTRFESAFREGRDFAYGIFAADESVALGSAGLHPRIGAGGLEIGYWVRADRVRQGFATEAARGLTECGLGAQGVERIEIHCDPDNIASRRIPERLGYVLVETRRGDTTSPGGEPRDTMVYRVTQADLPLRP